MISIRVRTVAVLVGLSAAAAAAAHEHGGVAGGLVSGALHPISGLDHLVAMVAVGLWGAQLGAPALWALPIAFPLVMALGGLLGVLGVPLPAPELFVAISALALGAAVSAQVHAPLPVAVTVVALFAVFHGHAHGTELPHAADPLAYGVGFVVATGLLHLCGIAIGSIARWPAGARAIRALGGSIATLGAYFLATNLGILR